MPPLTAPVASRLDDESVTAPVRVVAGYLEQTIGGRMAAALAGLGDPRQIGRYAEEGGPQPRPLIERRLREGYKIVRMLSEVHDAGTARAWLFGTNTRLDDRAPIEVLGQADSSETFTAVVRAARQVASFQGVSDGPQPSPLWRVGYRRDPLGFAPAAIYEYSHRFDDVRQRFRTLYCAELPEAALREVLADFRPNLAARKCHVDRYGPDAAQDFAPAPVTAAWRSRHVLMPLTLQLAGEVVDLTDVEVRQEVDERHLGLLVEHDLSHL